MHLALLAARITLGSIIAAHGAQKLFGWFRGYGIDGTSKFLESLGFRPGRTFAYLAGWTELIAGLLTAVGLLGPVGPALVVSVMIVAIFTVHWKGGLFLQNNGYEYALTTGVLALLLAFTGPGAYSVDALVGFGIGQGLTTAVVLGSLLAGGAHVVLRRPAEIPSAVE